MTIMTCMTHDMYDFSLVFFVCHSSSRGVLKSTSDYCFRLKHETGKITSQISCLDTLSCHSSKFFSILEHPPLVLPKQSVLCTLGQPSALLPHWQKIGFIPDPCVFVQSTGWKISDTFVQSSISKWGVQTLFISTPT